MKNRLYSLNLACFWCVRMARFYFGTVQTMPFARPAFDQILGALDFVIAKNYPARGEVIDHTNP